MSASDLSDHGALVVVQMTISAPTTYALDDAARLAGVHPEMLQYYCRLGLFGDERARPGATLNFDDDALYELRRFEHFRRRHGVSRKTLRLVCGLWREVEQLRQEVQFLRNR